MSLATRLDRLVPALSGRQRAVLILRALAAGHEPDPELRQIADERERQTFNRCMALIYVVNVELEAMLQALLFHAQRLDADMTLDLLREAGALVEQDTGEHPDPRTVKNWRRAKEVNVTEFILGVAEDVRSTLLVDVLQRWRELQAVETVCRELAAEFEGEDLLLPEVRQVAEQARELLRAQLQRLGAPRRLPLLNETLLQGVRNRVERAFDVLGLAAPQAAGRLL